MDLATLVGRSSRFKHNGRASIPVLVINLNISRHRRCSHAQLRRRVVNLRCELAPSLFCREKPKLHRRRRNLLCLNLLQQGTARIVINVQIHISVGCPFLGRNEERASVDRIVLQNMQQCLPGIRSPSQGDAGLFYVVELVFR